MDLVDERRWLERPLPARPWRRPLSRELRHGGAGARCRHRRLDLGEPGRRGGARVHRHEPEPRHLRGQAVLGDVRRPPGRARCPNRRRGLEHPHRRPVTGLPAVERAGRRRWHGDPGARRLRSLHPRRLLHQRVRRRHRTTTLEVQHGGAGRRAGRQHLGQPVERAARRRRHLDHRQLRSRAEPRLLRRRAGKAVGRGEPWNDDARRGALHKLDGGAPAGDRRPGLALPARAGRDARPRRGVRAGARRSREPQGGLQRRQARYPVEARPGNRRVPQPQGDRLPERLYPGSIPRPERSPTDRTSSTPRWRSRSRPAPAPPAEKTGTP